MNFQKQINKGTDGKKVPSINILTVANELDILTYLTYVRR